MPQSTGNRLEMCREGTGSKQVTYDPSLKLPNQRFPLILRCTKVLQQEVLREFLAEAPSIPTCDVYCSDNQEVSARVVNVVHSVDVVRS